MTDKRRHGRTDTTIINEAVRKMQTVDLWITQWVKMLILMRTKP